MPVCASGQQLVDGEATFNLTCARATACQVNKSRWNLYLRYAYQCLVWLRMANVRCAPSPLGSFGDNGRLYMGLGWGLRGKWAHASNEMRIRWYNSIGRPRLYRSKTAERLGAIYFQPSDMCIPDRIMLYALIRGLRPDRVLEIRVRWGGGAKIIAAALEDSGGHNGARILSGLRVSDPFSRDNRCASCLSRAASYQGRHARQP
jgi:hypothetical protein